MGEHDDREQRVTEILGGVMESDAAGQHASLLVPLPPGVLANRAQVEDLRAASMVGVAALVVGAGAL